MRRSILIAGLMVLGAGPALAQTSLPDAGAQLVVPPALRGTPASPPTATPATRKRKAVPVAAAGRPVEHAPAPLVVPAAAPPTDHPIGFGMQVHGGGSDPQHYSSTGGSAPGEESGNGVAAGFKVGF